MPDLTPSTMLKSLLEEMPSFHGQEQAGTKNWGLVGDVLDWIVQHVPPNARTLETGCGYSTVAFSTVSRQHTVLSPFSGEHDLIKKWCMAHGRTMDHVRFIAQSSTAALPTFSSEPLDVVLIDGGHEFPVPFIDWYYTAELVRKGGYIMVDDVHLPTGYILKDFLLAEAGRWAFVGQVRLTSMFQKVAESPVVQGISWEDQPWCRRDFSVKGRIKRKLMKTLGRAD
ncbi:MAG: class I SAM-dependent methyltransferase [Phycisphaerae bacterium]